MTADRPQPRCEFHVSRRARDRYRFDLGLFGSTGNVVFADFRAARLFADRMNAERDLVARPELAVKASQVNAMGLIDEMLHVILARYRERVRPGLMAEILADLEANLGADAISGLFAEFVDEFPPIAVYRGEVDAESYLLGITGSTPNREIVLEELVQLWLANVNPAFAPFRELFDDHRLRRETVYPDCVGLFRTAFADRPGLEEGGQNLLDLLMAPMRAAPDSLEGQLAYIRSVWGGHLGDLILRVLSSLDFVAEEEKPFFGFGPGPVAPPDYRDIGEAPEHYSPDQDWMPRLVLLAKNAHVWLDQLSKHYGRSIARLDEIPDDELDRLARWGFTGLWLIGVWERSRASERIKRMMGDADAVASAYSLADYGVALDLGGEAAYDNLKDRAWRRGIRLSTDMVPNHMGIDSRWVTEHPGWFIGLDQSPFPSYTFNGPDLSEDERVGIYLEDRYWDQSDAAVVFKRVDHWTGSARYIYHGNDGTSMPWNDTAQLDYRRAEVREAVIQTILHVARRSPIIRFDAAMTLAKQHYHRLWFPEPGSGGDIPSRAEHGMTRAEFDAVMPVEFWREVVDRVAVEAPDTLLLAEAFWLLEGYFVRTLGMHRVYNSAFMNMLRDERNADYRILIKSTLEYDPQILKRYVNFMSNPDERTAIDQFGADGKYFGVATLMATLPGLPMFGHGQVEGFAEKYGMEFRRPRWAESPDQGLVRRHERQLFPLLHRRGSFAEVDRFLLYDLVDEHGRVNENVFAYSNDVGGVRSLVIFHNTFAETRGWLRRSTAKIVRRPDGSTRLHHATLAEGLGVGRGDGRFLVMRDIVSGLEHLRPCDRLHDEGLFVELDAYRCHVFLDIRELEDDADGRLSGLAEQLAGSGTESVDLALVEIGLRDVLDPFVELVAAPVLESLFEARSGGPAAADRPHRVGQLLPALADMLDAVRSRLRRESGEDAEPSVGRDADEVVRAVRRDLERILVLSETDETAGRASDDLGWWAAVLGWVLLRRLGEVGNRPDPRGLAARWVDEWMLGRALGRQVASLGLGASDAENVVAVVRLLMAVDGWWAAGDGETIDLVTLAADLVGKEPGRSLLGVNRHNDVLWFRAEAFDEVLELLRVAAVLDTWGDIGGVEGAEEALGRLAKAGAASGWRVTDLISGLGD
jgi:glycosidase